MQAKNQKSKSGNVFKDAQKQSERMRLILIDELDALVT